VISEISDGNTEQVPTAKAGDVIGAGFYDAPGGRSIVYVDFVADEELFRVSGGNRGWYSRRAGAAVRDEAGKEAEAHRLAAEIAKELRSAVLTRELEIHNALPDGLREGARVFVFKGPHDGVSGTVVRGNRYQIFIKPDRIEDAAASENGDGLLVVATGEWLEEGVRT
jgi:hypothetical protein